MNTSFATGFAAGLATAPRILCAIVCACVTGLPACALAEKPAAQTEPPENAAASGCLQDGSGYLRGRLSGAIDAELDWPDEGTECTGAIRPTDGGIRLRFGRLDEDGKLVLVFGIADLEEGRAASTVPVNVTVIREGAGEFFSTQGDDKCMLDSVRQEPLVGAPFKARSYRIVARGFCTEPARAVRGTGAVMLSRFDFAGRVDFETEDTSEDVVMAAQ